MTSITKMKSGGKHDNDHASITDIKILPTTDEIVCRSPVCLPEKKRDMNVSGLLDAHFRHLRYDETEQIVNACHDAIQRVIRPEVSSRFNFETPNGIPYSLLTDVKFEACQFHRFDGAAFSLSFDCPPPLRGFTLLKSNIFEAQKLCSLIAVHTEEDKINVIHFEVKERQPSDPSSKTSRNRAFVQVCLADRTDISKVQQASQYVRGLLKAKFFLVNLPGVLPISFVPALQMLQAYHQKGTFPFAEIIAPGSDQADFRLLPPEYAQKSGFKYDISSLKAKTSDVLDVEMRFEPMKDGVADQATIERIKQQTTLDDGQAVALYENLSRRLAFSQGPPGTGKTFLGVAEAEVILNSQPVNNNGKPTKPIVVICMTNHALDDFVESLIGRGIDKILRLGNRSKHEWMFKYSMQKLKERKRLPPEDWHMLKMLSKENDQISNLGLEWANELSGSGSFRMLYDYLKVHEPDILAEFERLDASGDIATDLRFLRMSSAGFTFKYWLRGGDLNDLASLLDKGLRNDFSALSLASENIQSQSREDLGFHQYSDLEIIENSFKNARSNTSDALDLSALQKALDQFAERCRANHNTHKIWLLKLADRQALFASWMRSVDQSALCMAYAKIHRRHQDHQRARWSLVHEIDARLTLQAGVKIVALTATGAARSRGFLEALKPETYIFEEASELTEAVTLASLVESAQHVIKIGDPLQLRPHINTQILSAEYDKRYRLDESLFERLMDKISYSKLHMQRRAHPELANLLRAGSYPFLVDHPKTNAHPAVPGFKYRMYWLDHNLMEDQPDPGSPLAKSCSNKYEARFIAEAVKYLVQHQGFSMKQITILTPYNGQVAQILAYLKEFCNVLLNDEDRASLVAMGLLPEDDLTSGSSASKDVPLDSLIRLTTIDNYQGEENDVIFLSPVRSNTRNKIGFLANQNRINVAVSRARNAFYVVGNASLLSQKNAGWSKILKVFQSHDRIGSQMPMLPCAKHGLVTNHVVDIHHPENFHTLPVCQEPCKAKLSCGHQCMEPCHAEEMHTDGRLKCCQSCNKKLECGHSCSNLCHQECGPCKVPMKPVTLDCGHKTQVQCSTNLDKLQCNVVLVAFRGLCGHLRFKRCSTGLQPCSEPCEKPYPCGHKCPNICSTCEHTGCLQDCGKTMDCGHICPAKCHHTTEQPCPPCKEPCLKRCVHGSCKLTCSEVCKPCTKEVPAGHCVHQEKALLCSLPGSRIPCSKSCSLLAPCGLHQCQGLCGEDCPEVCDICIQAPKRDNLIVLPCKCIFDVAELDSKFQMSKIYKMDSITIVGIDITSQPDKESLKCPNCAGSIAGCRRYALCLQIHEHNNVIGSLLSPIGRQLWKSMASINIAQSDLWWDLTKICDQIKPGPLAIKNNQLVISQSLAGIQSIQREVERFQPDIELIQNAILSYTASLISSDPENIGDDTLLGIPSLPYLLRGERVTIRCNIVTAKYLLDIRTTVKALGQLDDHLNMFLEVLRANARTNLKGCVKRLDNLISQCEAMNLKRLGVEFFIQKVCVIGLERRLGQETENTSAQFKEAFELCNSHKSVRQLYHLVSSADGFIKGNTVSVKLDDALNAPKDPQQVAAQMLWKKLAIFEAGTLAKCASGHFYSSAHFTYCPECG